MQLSTQINSSQMRLESFFFFFSSYTYQTKLCNAIYKYNYCKWAKLGSVRAQVCVREFWAFFFRAPIFLIPPKYTSGGYLSDVLGSYREFYVFGTSN